MQWDDIFKNFPKVRLIEPKKEVIAFEQLLAEKTEPKTARVYDLGFGAGRHIVFFAKKGYQVFGDDISEKGKDLTDAWLKRHQLTAQTGISDMTRIPYPDAFFDAILSIGVIMHSDINSIRTCISEIHRTLKTNGLVLVNFLSKNGSKFKKAQKIDKQIEENTYINQKGLEKGILHHYSTKVEVVSLMKDFTSINLYHDKELIKGVDGNYFSTHWVYTGKKR